jgi:hypothetical protein
MTVGLQAFLNERFPESSSDKDNPAVKLYGKRFYKDQTPVEYLAELLLVFLSPKGSKRNAEETFEVKIDGEPCYWPEDRAALKLFAFYPGSKLETRHHVHQEAYKDAIIQIKENVEASEKEKDETIRILQSLLSGFTGVAKNRTWITHSFLPASNCLINRELAWQHSKAKNDKKVIDWQSSTSYIHHDRHLFMARGGEALFLQLANLFADKAQYQQKLASSLAHRNYAHLQDIALEKLEVKLQKSLSSLVKGSMDQVDRIAKFIENTLEDKKVFKEPKVASLGWVPKSSSFEAFLFAVEITNICASDALSELDKLELMQYLCCLQVLRSLSFQAMRVSSVSKTNGFEGNYAWITANPDADSRSSSRKLAEQSFAVMEFNLYQVIRVVHEQVGGAENELKPATEHGFKIFRKISKEIGLVIPKTGQGQRFVLPPILIRVLVASVLAPGERVLLTEFYRRVFCHFGIAISGEQLSVASDWLSDSSGSQNYISTDESLWIEEALKQGGFLVELSDAVSMVYNRGSKEQKF